MPAANTPWPKLKPAFVKNQLTGHKVLGLWLAALMYIICVSGTAAVFFQDFERWEKPSVPEMSPPSPEAVARAVADARTKMIADTDRDPLAEDLFVVLPTRELPRLTAGWDHTSIAYDASGAPAGDAGHPLTHFLVELHYQLHIPGGVGLLLVGMLGVGLLALIVGGVLAHPRILKDAFLMRPTGSRRLALTDVHNRLGVWALPFHIVIALTGAIIGLAQVVGFALALAFHGGDFERVFEPIFGSEAEMQAIMRGQKLADGAVVRSLHEMRAKAPEARPMWVALHKVGTPEEHLEITALLPKSTAYGEIFRFDAQGRLHSRAHLDDGPTGKQAYASLYPLHFGSFGGLWVKLAYAILGAGLCIICATGVDIWLVKSAEKGKPHPRIHRVWTVFVWTMPACLPLAAAAHLLTGWSPVAMFWGLLALITGASIAGSKVVAAPQAAWSAASKITLGASLVVLPLVHLVVFRSLSPAAAGPNAVMAALGLAILAHALWRSLRATPKLRAAPVSSAPGG